MLKEVNPLEQDTIQEMPSTKVDDHIRSTINQDMAETPPMTIIKMFKWDRHQFTELHSHKCPESFTCNSLHHQVVGAKAFVSRQ